MVRIWPTKWSKYETLKKMRVGLVISNDEIKKYEVNELYNLFNSNYEISYIFSEKKKRLKK